MSSRAAVEAAAASTAIVASIVVLALWSRRSQAAILQPEFRIR